MASRWLSMGRLAALAERRPPASAFSLNSLSHTSFPPPLANTPTSLPPSSSLPELCGRGDRKTKKGKRFRGTYGKARPKKDKKIERIKERVEVPSSTPWPLPFKLI